MNIYQLDMTGIKKQLIAFHKTAYGKIVFCLSYALPSVSFIWMIVLLLTMMNTYHYCYPIVMFGYYIWLLGLILFTLITFVIGSMNYYKELRRFVASQPNKKMKQ